MPCAVNGAVTVFRNQKTEPTMPEPARTRDGEALSKLEEAADEAITACGGDARAAVIALLVANDFLERELDLTRVAVSSGFSRQWHQKRGASRG
jgi:hypothetical protein